ncbi:hypothetical protein [Bradyrhizobium sp. SZCCHNR1093]|uniref:hypothetical protein n=1 Tax=Bradyrhizobium sp. SZCCHNR1093 TaxID=3057368 RepID=UPI0028E2B19E|nr:hypothetical protein [Bradyrhizobium sp. SZCCHNR1093]
MPTLGGCFLSVNPPPPAPAAAPQIMPRQCQRVLREVPDPGVKVGDDLGNVAAGYRAAYLKANHRIVAGRACDDQQAVAIERGAK